VRGSEFVCLSVSIYGFVERITAVGVNALFNSELRRNLVGIEAEIAFA